MTFLLSIAVLALGVIAPAQDRSRDTSHDRGPSRSDRPSRSRADRDRRSSDSDRRSDPRSSDSRPSGSRTSDSRGGDPRTDPLGTDSRGTDSRGANPRSNDSRIGGSRGNDTRGSDSRTNDSRNSDPRGSGRQGQNDDRTNRRDVRGGSASDRFNPFDRSGGGYGRNGGAGGNNGRFSAPTPNPRGRAVLGVPVHDRGPGYWDGRGHASAQRFGPPPVHNALSIAINTGGPYRGTEVAVGAKIGGLRIGFVSYSAPSRSYRRDYYGYGPGYTPTFGYSYYAYDPYVPGAVVVASPWYGYSYLPPYLDRSRVTIVNDYPSWNWDDWHRYDYERDHEERNRDTVAVHNAIDDLRDAFEESSTRIADRLIPEEGDIAIFNEGKYDYSLNPDDFQKMFLDGIEQSKTVRYEIEEVRTRGDEVRIRARHTYEDSWGSEQSIVHTITLRRENGGDYVIREFGSQ